MIEAVTIGNFKSLELVTLRLGQFNCLVGMNGAGKSTILQALDLLAQLMHGSVDQWLKARGWASKDLYCQVGDSHVAHRSIVLTVALRLDDGRKLTWLGTFKRGSMRLFSEEVSLANEQILVVLNNKCSLLSRSYIITQDYTGSILASLKDNLLSPELKTLRDTIRNIRSLELLSPHLLRKTLARARQGHWRGRRKIVRLSGYTQRRTKSPPAGGVVPVLPPTARFPGGECPRRLEALDGHRGGAIRR